MESFSQVVTLLRRAQGALGDSISAYEVMWASYFDHVVQHIDDLRSPFDDIYPLYVLIETEGAEQDADARRFETVLESALEADVIKDAVIAQSERDRQTFWAIRDGVGEITKALTPYASLDVSMDIAEMPGFLDDFDEALSSALPDALNLVFGHVGDNNLHLFVTTRRQNDIDEILRIGYELTGAHRGSISAEHGIGTLKRDYLHLSRTAAEIELMQRLKKALDPKEILNPGRVIPD